MRFCSCFAHQCLPRWLLQCWKVARSKRLFARQTHLRSQESSPQGEIWKENRAEVWFWFILMRHQCIVGWNMIYYNISYFIGWAVSVERVSVDHHHHHQGAVPELRAWATLWTNLWYADLSCAFRTGPVLSCLTILWGHRSTAYAARLVFGGLVSFPA